MRYYATIYIHPMNWNIPHAFLGLTKDKSPDELDKIDEESKQKFLKTKNLDQSKILSKSVIIKQFICIRSKFANSYLF